MENGKGEWKRRTENGEWKIEIGECRMENRELRTPACR
jgi:hypothetical protein